MIDKTPKYWTGDSPDDITEWLHEYTEEPSLEIHPVLCRNCKNDALEARIDGDEGVVQIICPECKTKKILLDGEEIWSECHPKKRKCIVCKNNRFNIRVGFIRRDNGDVKWVYIGERCTQCGTLASYADWNINFGPTDEMEQNI